VTILRERHPFEGRSLAVMSAIKRRGTLSLLVVLPDGSRALIPASWTDWTATAEEPAQSRPEHRDFRPRIAGRFASRARDRGRSPRSLPDSTNKARGR
jgi:hypothetical protein